MGRLLGKKRMHGAATPHYPAGTIPGQPAAGHHPFKSKAQQRLFFANPKLRRWAIGKAHATGEHHEITHALGFSPAYRALPDRLGSTFNGVPLRSAVSKKKGKR
jgi:hypothetical protein